MSSQRGNASRSRSQKHKNATAFKNDKYGASAQVKKANSKVHGGLCQRCKDVLEWKVKYNKYKSLTQPRKCVKCSQKTVKDAYHIMCKPCALQLELCAKCGKKEDIVIPINSEKEGQEEEGDEKKEMQGRSKKDFEELDSEDDDFGSDEDFINEDDDENFASDSKPKKTGT